MPRFRDWPSNFWLPHWSNRSDLKLKFETYIYKTQSWHISRRKVTRSPPIIHRAHYCVSLLDTTILLFTTRKTFLATYLLFRHANEGTFTVKLNPSASFTSSLVINCWTVKAPVIPALIWARSCSLCFVFHWGQAVITNQIFLCVSLWVSALLLECSCVSFSICNCVAK